MIMESLFPVFVLLAAGNLLKRFHFTSEEFLKISDRLVYFIFFPALLFWKIGGSGKSSIVDPALIFSGLFSVIVIYSASILSIRLLPIPHFQAGTFSQSCYRFNTYIGMAIIINLYGDTGIMEFGILIGFLIPFINVLAVSTLIWYSGKSQTPGKKARKTLGAIVSNPLIIACFSGIVYARTFKSFPGFLENTFRLGASVTLPLALLSIGATLSVKNVKSYLKVSMLSQSVKLILFPLVGIFFMKLFHVTGIRFGVGLIFFCLPTSTAIYVLSSQMKSDTILASTSIALSTALSFISLAIAISYLF